jgi:hypothetical protein
MPLRLTDEQIVPPESSSLDHPNQRARSIVDDHIGMVKFQGKGDKAYEMIKSDIEELVEKAKHNTIARM